MGIDPRDYYAFLGVGQPNERSVPFGGLIHPDVLSVRLDHWDSGRCVALFEGVCGSDMLSDKTSSVE